MNHQEIRDLIYNVVVLGARENFARDGVVHAWTFILATRDPDNVTRTFPEPGLVAVPTNMLMDNRDLLREVQQRLCEELGAVALAFVTEAWRTRLDSSKVYEDIAEARKHRKEIIQVYLETREGNVLWTIPITRDADNRGTLGETEEESDLHLNGRLTGYFQAQRPEIEA